MESENLGRGADWQIRDFPMMLREEIVGQAKERNETVSQFLTRQLLALRNAGWRPSGGSQAHGLAPTMPTVEEVCAAIDATSKVSHLGDAVQVGVKSEANRLLKVLLLDLKVRYKLAVGVSSEKSQLAIAVDQTLERIAAE